MGVVQCVTGLPSTIEKAVMYWRKGCREKGVRPVRIYLCPRPARDVCKIIQMLGGLVAAEEFVSKIEEVDRPSNRGARGRIILKRRRM